MSAYTLTTLVDDGAHARAIMAALEEAIVPAPDAVSSFEVSAARFRGHDAETSREPPSDGITRWQIAAYYADAVDADAIRDALAALGLTSPEPWTLTRVPDVHWVSAVQAGLPPVRAGRILIYGRHDAAVGRQRLHALNIDAGEAFGTAHHATTLGCLETLDRLMRMPRRHPPRVLDLGCGSGVLALAAVKHWPGAEVLGSDIDPEAVRVAKTNATLNGAGAGARARFVTAAGVHRHALGHQAFDVVLANILAQPLIQLAPALAGKVKRGGDLVLSGILNPQSRAVIARYRALGFHLVAHRRLEGWSTLHLRRAL